jgi:tRNA 2-selenouridine synthase
VSYALESQKEIVTRSLPRVLPEEIADFHFDEIIDVRSPDEFLEDHISGALNLAVLDDSERSQVGTVYHQQSPFEARRLGAGLVSANIASQFSNHFHDKGKDYMPLVYCWRGGQRSNSLATVLSAVGWKAHLLSGGYKAYRKFISASLKSILDRGADFRVVAGLTGTGKTWLLKRLDEMGQQVIDLEGIASHRGSALGKDPARSQPSQKRFENILREKLVELDFSKPIYLESESSRVGCLQIPDGLWTQMKSAPVIELCVPLKARADYLLRAYTHFTERPELLLEQLEPIRTLRSREMFIQWEDDIEQGNFMDFVASILENHYDPAYLRSRNKTFKQSCAKLAMDTVCAENLDAIARDIVELEGRFTDISGSSN